MGPRAYVGDVQDSVFFVRFKPHQNQLSVFADDCMQRFVTATAIVDYNTMAVADKFGTVSIVSAVDWSAFVCGM